MHELVSSSDEVVLWNQTPWLTRFSIKWARRVAMPPSCDLIFDCFNQSLLGQLGPGQDASMFMLGVALWERPCHEVFASSLRSETGPRRPQRSFSSLVFAVALRWTSSEVVGAMSKMRGSGVSLCMFLCNVCLKCQTKPSPLGTKLQCLCMFVWVSTVARSRAWIQRIASILYTCHGCLGSRRSARTFRLIAPYAGLHLKLWSGHARRILAAILGGISAAFGKLCHWSVAISKCLDSYQVILSWKSSSWILV